VVRGRAEIGGVGSTIVGVATPVDSSRAIAVSHNPTADVQTDAPAPADGVPSTSDHDWISPVVPATNARNALTTRTAGGT
jgi:hypothetical protein